MTLPSKRCTRCGGRMEAGFTFAHDSGGGTVVPNWHPGAPEKSWVGTVKVEKTAVRAVTAYRCERCGIIDYYAE